MILQSIHFFVPNFAPVTKKDTLQWNVIDTCNWKVTCSNPSAKNQLLYLLTDLTNR